MDKIGLVLLGLLVFVILTFLYWKLTNGYVKKLYGRKMWQQWSSRLYYWHSALFVSGALTVMVLLFLKTVNVLPF